MPEDGTKSTKVFCEPQFDVNSTRPPFYKHNLTSGVNAFPVSCLTSGALNKLAYWSLQDLPVLTYLSHH